MRLDQPPTSVCLAHSLRVFCFLFYLTTGLVVRAFGEEPMGVNHKENLGFRRSSRNVSLQTT